MLQQKLQIIFTSDNSLGASIHLGAHRATVEQEYTMTQNPDHRITGPYTSDLCDLSALKLPGPADASKVELIDALPELVVRLARRSLLVRRENLLERTRDSAAHARPPVARLTAGATQDSDEELPRALSVPKRPRPSQYARSHVGLLCQNPTGKKTIRCVAMQSALHLYSIRKAKTTEQVQTAVRSYTACKSMEYKPLRVGGSTCKSRRERQYLSLQLSTRPCPS